MNSKNDDNIAAVVHEIWIVYYFYQDSGRWEARFASSDHDAMQRQYENATLQAKLRKRFALRGTGGWFILPKKVKFIHDDMDIQTS